MIISLTGNPGSGKTSVAKLLAAELGYKWYSMGDLRGKYAMEHGMTLEELNYLGETDPNTDKMIDDFQTKLGETEDNFIVDGRLSWHFIPHSFKIFLVCDLHEAARRIFAAAKDPQANRADEKHLSSEEEVYGSLTRRIASDVTRYRTHYGIDLSDMSHFDVVIDTTKNTGPEQTFETIMEALRDRGLR